MGLLFAIDAGVFNRPDWFFPVGPRIVMNKALPKPFGLNILNKRPH